MFSVPAWVEVPEVMKRRRELEPWRAEGKGGGRNLSAHRVDVPGLVQHLALYHVSGGELLVQFCAFGGPCQLTKSASDVSEYASYPQCSPMHRVFRTETGLGRTPF